ncbi:hypothetical protein HYH03_012095 [Edaphochlamys debaryana]|uniref:Beta-lactamase-related domain-containing protein n=1 Tax=Edaphochlamys debaryana TaxID=47281 RepID=A0A836BVW4_9CHLO|nr:hypothetical protein HYH03_012095 [Edaphochlamys debaryana]|eukprot:KAG2489459.1 hypothetical protein HYH03_012095 [Edaphochlamys debaryana]
MTELRKAGRLDPAVILPISAVKTNTSNRLVVLLLDLAMVAVRQKLEDPGAGGGGVSAQTQFLAPLGFAGGLLDESLLPAEVRLATAVARAKEAASAFLAETAESSAVCGAIEATAERLKRRFYSVQAELQQQRAALVAAGDSAACVAVAGSPSSSTSCRMGPAAAAAAACSSSGAPALPNLWGAGEAAAAEAADAQAAAERATAASAARLSALLAGLDSHLQTHEELAQVLFTGDRTKPSAVEAAPSAGAGAFGEAATAAPSDAPQPAMLHPHQIDGAALAAAAAAAGEESLRARSGAGASGSAAGPGGASHAQQRLVAPQLPYGPDNLVGAVQAFSSLLNTLAPHIKQLSMAGDNAGPLPLLQPPSLPSSHAAHVGHQLAVHRDATRAMQSLSGRMKEAAGAYEPVLRRLRTERAAAHPRDGLSPRLRPFSLDDSIDFEAPQSLLALPGPNTASLGPYSPVARSPSGPFAPPGPGFGRTSPFPEGSAAGGMATGAAAASPGGGAGDLDMAVLRLRMLQVSGATSMEAALGGGGGSTTALSAAAAMPSWGSAPAPFAASPPGAGLSMGAGAASMARLGSMGSPSLLAPAQLQQQQQQQRSPAHTAMPAATATSSAFGGSSVGRSAGVWPSWLDGAAAPAPAPAASPPQPPQPRLFSRPAPFAPPAVPPLRLGGIGGGPAVAPPQPGSASAAASTHILTQKNPPRSVQRPNERLDTEAQQQASASARRGSASLPGSQPSQHTLLSRLDLSLSPEASPRGAWLPPPPQALPGTTSAFPFPSQPASKPQPAQAQRMRPVSSPGDALLASVSNACDAAMARMLPNAGNATSPGAAPQAGGAASTTAASAAMDLSDLMRDSSDPDDPEQEGGWGSGGSQDGSSSIPRAGFGGSGGNSHGGAFGSFGGAADAAVASGAAGSGGAGGAGAGGAWAGLGPGLDLDASLDFGLLAEEGQRVATGLTSAGGASAVQPLGSGSGGLWGADDVLIKGRLAVTATTTAAADADDVRLYDKPVGSSPAHSAGGVGGGKGFLAGKGPFASAGGAANYGTFASPSSRNNTLSGASFGGLGGYDVMAISPAPPVPRSPAAASFSPTAATTSVTGATTGTGAVSSPPGLSLPLGTATASAPAPLSPSGSGGGSSMTNNSGIYKAVGVLAGVSRFDPYVAKLSWPFSGINPIYVKAWGSDGITGVTSNVGFRNWNTKKALQDDDNGRIGSCTKSFTATAMAMLISQNKTFCRVGISPCQNRTLRWNTTLQEIFPLYGMRLVYQSVRIQNLLNMMAGLRRDFPYTGYNLVISDYNNLVQSRRQFAQKLLLEPNITVPASGMSSYSNAGYILAGHIIDVISGKSWETVIKEWIFQPLGLTSAKIGPIGNNGDDVPYGHIQINNGAKNASNWEFKPIYGDTTRYMAPAGDINMSPRDHALWAAWHLSGRTPGVLKTFCTKNWTAPCITEQDFAMLHADPPGGTTYAMGWWRSSPNWGPGINTGGATVHNGILNGWYAEQWTLPNENIALSVMTNHFRLNFTDNKTNIMPNNVVNDVLRNLAGRYKLPACGPNTTVQAWGSRKETNATNSCWRVTDTIPNTYCKANAGYLGATNYAAPASAANTWACAQLCINDKNCTAWNYKLNSTNLFTACNLIKVINYVIPIFPIGSGRRHRRSLTEGAPGTQEAHHSADDAADGTEDEELGALTHRRQLQSTLPWSCTANNSYTSGIVRRINSTSEGLISFGAAAPYNNPNFKDAPCASSDAQCRDWCLRSQQGVNKCTGWTYNLSTKKCLLFKGALVRTNQTLTAHCVVFSGMVKNCTGTWYG